MSYKINWNNHGRTLLSCTEDIIRIGFSSQVGELKKQNHELLERVHHLQNEVTDSDMRRHELENQLRNANTVSEQMIDKNILIWDWFSFLFNVKKVNKK